MARENYCIITKYKQSYYQLKGTQIVFPFFKKGEKPNPLRLPKVTNPAFADNAFSGAPLSSIGGEGDHKQGGALLSPAVRLASTNS